MNEPKLVVMGSNTFNADTSWQYNNEAWVLTRKLSALLWKHYNPKAAPSDEPIKKD